MIDDIKGYFIGSLLFLFGCLAFVADAIIAKNKIYFTGSVLFTIGTLFYLLDSIRLLQLE